MSGRLSCVNTHRTPVSATAASASMLFTRPRAIVLETIHPYTRPLASYSPAYFASPVTFARPSTRFCGRPMKASVIALLHADRLSERPHDRAACKLDLEGVVLLPARAFEISLGDVLE